jgi:hypothetical protein
MKPQILQFTNALHGLKIGVWHDVSTNRITGLNANFLWRCQKCMQDNKEYLQ